MTDARPGKRSFKSRLGFASRSQVPRQRLSKKAPGIQELASEESSLRSGSPTLNDGTPRKQSLSSSLTNYDDEDFYISPELLGVAPEERYKLRQRHRPAQRPDPHKHVIDKDTGERSDLTEMLHALHFDADLDSIQETHVEDGPEIDPLRPRGERILAQPSAEIWDRITDFLEPREAANLALTCKTLWTMLGRRPFDRLRLPRNKQQRIDFLLPMNGHYPTQLFCFPCGSYHVRTHPGGESLKPTNVLNPLFICPNSTNNLIPPPRIRITSGRTLPFAFVQLVTRAWQHGPEYGVPLENITRKWRDPYGQWTHQTKYHIHKNGHLQMRVVSQVFADGGLTLAAKRMLLYSRDDYIPYFSVCAHWRDGLLMDLCKCALDHIPVPKRRAAALGGIKHTGPTIASLCGNCSPMRRCPQCPSEYLIELKLVEDKSVPMSHHARFKQSLVLTRWSDLGPGRSPQDREWAAIQGDYDDYDSIEEVGKRSVSSTFESAFGDSYPNQRLLNLNPKNIREGEEGNKWY